ncbi:MAG: hypothetical protein F4178_08750 [Rhodospirillaceae bacterium]|nr:hypothetical protein [Rhodospirillaceae bacterium]MYH32960.1 hypothetical protein [Gammaproteobacteria bacterium]
MTKRSSEKTETAVAEAKRSPHTIRFFDPEWERIEKFAEARGLAPAEYVRSATLSAVVDNGVSVAELAQFIERTFRATYMLASRMRNEMLEAGEQDELDTLVADARWVQQKIQRPASE